MTAVLGVLNFHGLVKAMKSGYVVDMAGQAKISELKNRLSHYLGRVRRGESILVLDRDRVIARISPVSESPSDQTDSAMLEDLERRGVIRRRGGRLPREWLSQRPTLKADVLAALLDERDEGR